MPECTLNKPMGKVIYFVKGDGQDLLVTFTGPGESTLEGAVIEFRVGAAVGANAIISKSSAISVEISIDAEAAQCTIYFNAADTADLAAGNYVYMLRVALSGGKPITVALNNFILCDTIEAAA